MEIDYSLLIADMKRFDQGRSDALEACTEDCVKACFDCTKEQISKRSIRETGKDYHEGDK